MLESARKAGWHVSRQAARRVAGERARCAGAGAGMPHNAQHAQRGTTSQLREETTRAAPGRRLLSSTPKLPGEPAASGGSAGGGGGGDGGGSSSGQEGPSETQKTIQVPAAMLLGVQRCRMACSAAGCPKNSKPQTPNPKPQTPNPKPQTPNPKP
jgi:hypothetical protein